MSRPLRMPSRPKSFRLHDNPKLSVRRLPWLCLSPNRIQKSAGVSQEITRARLEGPGSAIVADHINGIAVLEYGSTEILLPVGQLFTAPASLCRTCREPSRAHPPGKPGFSTYEGGFGRETDSPVERDGFEPSVPRDRDDGFRSNSPARRLPERDPQSRILLAPPQKLSYRCVAPGDFIYRCRRKPPKRSIAARQTRRQCSKLGEWLERHAPLAYEGHDR
jgi:hypothetical protein